MTEKVNLSYISSNPLSIAGLEAEELRILTTINQKLSLVRTLEELIDCLYSETAQLMQTDRIGLALYEDGRLWAHYLLTNYEPIKLSASFVQSLEGSSLKRVIEAGEPRIIDDLEKYVEDHPESEGSKLLVEEGIRSSMTCPLRVGGKTIGLLFRSSRQSKAFTEKHIAMHFAIAERLGYAMERAYWQYRYQEMRRDYYELLSSLKRLTKRPLSDLLTHLKEMDKTKDKFEEKIKEHFDIMNHASVQLDRRLKHFYDLHRVNPHRKLEISIIEGVNLQEAVLDPCLEELSEELVESGMVLDMVLPKEEATVECDPELLKRACIQLLRNAIRYGLEGGHISLELDITSEEFSIRVWNEGLGFPPEEKTRLFRAFSRIKSGQKPGSGIGLYIAWRIARMHGGRLKAESESGKWAEFKLIIPQPIDV